MRFGMSAALLSLAISQADAGAQPISLVGVHIVADSEQPSYLRHAVADLAGFLKDAIGTEVPIGVSPAVKAPALIAIGPEACRRVTGQELPVDGLGAEGFILKIAHAAFGGRILVAGASPRGTRAGVYALMRAIELGEKSAIVPASLDIRHVPAFATRGMHLNGWAFRSPYSFRAWREEEWRRYLDILAYQGVNLFYLWPFMEIMPVPLSPEDRAYLEECRRVIDYAHEAHGMEVWIMQCTNRVARDRCGVDDPRLRPYWRTAQEDLNPGNAQHLEAILASREALYKALDNVDGVCNIDSDPGYCPGSSLDDYVKVLQGCRALLDRHNMHGRKAKLVHWMWCGWGLPHDRAFEPEHHALTLRLLKERLPEPWGIVAGGAGNLEVCRKEGLLGKTVYLPYGLIEDEPSYPATNLAIDAVRADLEAHADPASGLLGVMGNVQTPLLQLPHVYCFTASMDDRASVQKAERDVVLDCCRLLYPENASLLADSYLALRDTEPARIAGVADRLDARIKEDKLGRLGCIGRKLFPDSGIVARALLLQLRHLAARERLAAIGATPPSAEECAAIVRDYVDGYLSWDTAHGWHALWGWQAWPLGDFTADRSFAPMAAQLRKRWGDEASVNARFEAIALELSRRHDARVVREGGIALLRDAVLSARSIESLAQKATATASVLADPMKYPASAANDGLLATLYWPGALVQNNAEWLQLTWDEPTPLAKVVVHFLKHPSMVGRTIHLQAESRGGAWEDIATTTVPDEPNAPHCVATFTLPSGTALPALRIVNLLDLFEVEAY